MRTTRENAIKWALANKILNLLRSYKGEKLVAPEQNPYGLYKSKKRLKKMKWGSDYGIKYMSLFVCMIRLLGFRKVRWNEWQNGELKIHHRKKEDTW